MATKLAAFGGPSQHTSGLYADMSVDGPEIGTLVVIVDRAKNLPNRKSIGKQNPYCAARLGKEAKKTDTERRGGQTPKWDQELRFTVHDSPDYDKLKVSVFSEDKRTADLIGESWVSLTEVIVPGGGKGDVWQGLNCKGKYAGEIRIEMTYYDSRPKPEGAESVVGLEDLGRSIGSGSRVKRRPLPSSASSGHVTPDSIPQLGYPGRAKHGPRDLQMPMRANSMPPEAYSAPTVVHVHRWEGAPAGQTYQPPPSQNHEGYDDYQEPQTYDEPEYREPTLPDLLPQLPPSNRQRGSLPPQPRFDSEQGYSMPRPRPQSHIGLHHTHSAPIIPQAQVEPHDYRHSSQLQLDYPEPIPDLEYQHQQLGARQRRNDVPPSWQSEYGDPHADRQPYVEEDNAPPPPPPMHSRSAPVVPHISPGHRYPASSPAPSIAGTPPAARDHSIPNSSPLQSIERKYATPQRVPPQTSRSYGNSPVTSQASQPPSPYTNSQPSSRLPPHRNSIADPYPSASPRPHPLSNEIPHSHSPDPYRSEDLPGASPQNNGNSPYEHEYRSREGLPLLKPRAISPGYTEPPAPRPSAAFRPKSSYSLQNPVRAFESSDISPLSTSQSQPRPLPVTTLSTPRKLISPNPAPPHSAGATPFSPDSFNVHNPYAQQSKLGGQVSASPHSPYQVRPGSEANPREETNGPIKNWHGQEVDPSDRLPVDSWAPEPEVKIPTRTYGLGRDREFGPRSVQGGASSGARNLSKDTVVNFRSRAQTDPEAESPSRNRLQKKSTPTPARSPVAEPLRERHNYNSVSVPNPYEQPEFSRGLYHQPNERGYAGYGQPSGSPHDALTREISNIDIGSGRHSRTGSVPTPTAYVPVRSHKDRSSYY